MKRVPIRKLPLLILCITLLTTQSLSRIKDETKKIYTAPYIVTHWQVPLNPRARKSSLPYISGDAFREQCDFIIDETRIPFRPHAVKKGDTIFVNANFLTYFFATIHPKIGLPYILVTHNSDYDIPGTFANYLEDKKLAAWFGQNVTLKHPKMHPIPIGLANRCWQHGNPTLVNKALGILRKCVPTKKLLYMNFTITHPERTHLYELFINQPFCTALPPSNTLTPFGHLLDLMQHTFVLSPRGNGLDTHRTWEALLMGAIPIVHTSASDPLYDNLPVLIVDSWQGINEQMLRQKYENITQKKDYNVEKLYASYWIKKIVALQAVVRKS